MTRDRRKEEISIVKTVTRIVVNKCFQYFQKTFVFLQFFRVEVRLLSHSLHNVKNISERDKLANVKVETSRFKMRSNKLSRDSFSTNL